MIPIYQIYFLCVASVLTLMTKIENLTSQTMAVGFLAVELKGLLPKITAIATCYERQMKCHGENTVPTFLILPTVELAFLTAGVVFMAGLLATRMQKLFIKTDFLPSKRAVYVTSTPENNM